MNRLFWFVLGIFVGATFKGEFKVTVKQVDSKPEIASDSYSKNIDAITNELYGFKSRSVVDGPQIMDIQKNPNRNLNSEALSEIRQSQRRMRV